MRDADVVVLSGGVGAARFLAGLVRIHNAELITAIVNTGDDDEFHGLHVCPDMDIVTYTLADMVDADQGWGIGGDSFNCLEMLGRLGEPTWFRLGDKDLGVHIHRSHREKQGWTLDQITEEIRRSFGIDVKILPMTNDRVATKIDTGSEVLPFQEYFVKRGTKEYVKRVVFDGIEGSRPAPGVIESIMNARTVIVAPSNPLVSIGPILAVPGVRDALRKTGSVVVSITPIIGGKAIKGPAAAMMADTGHDVSALGVARLYRDFLDVMIVDAQDEHLLPRIERLGIRAAATDTIMDSVQKKERLASAVLEEVDM